MTRRWISRADWLQSICRSALVSSRAVVRPSSPWRRTPRRASRSASGPGPAAAIRGRASTSNSAVSWERRSPNWAAFSSRPMARARSSSTGPVSRPASIAMIPTPVLASPSSRLHWIGPAPRQRGSREPWPFQQPRGGWSSTASGRIWPKATTTERSAARAASWSWQWRSRRIRSGVNTGTPSSRARAFTGEASSSLPRPRRRSGWLTTPTRVWPAATRASRLGTA